MNNDTNTDTETEEYLTEESTQLKQIIRKNTIFLDHQKDRYSILCEKLQKVQSENLIKELLKEFKDTVYTHNITDNERQAILAGIDKCNHYTKERLMDLDVVCEYIYRIKQKNVNYIFHSLTLKSSEDRSPPNNYYKYTFITCDNGLIHYNS